MATTTKKKQKANVFGVVDDKFDAILESAISDMERVECPQSDYLSALESAARRFAEMAAMVRREIRAAQ